MSDLAAQMTALQIRIKELKQTGGDASAEVEAMKALKAQMGDKKKAAAGAEAAPAAAATGFQLKTPKGTIDHEPSATLLRKRIFNTLESIFVKYGASTIDTPVFELRDILAGKYGEDSKLIYDLQDQGGELCSLRYDLTVPFARYLAMKGITSMKRYHIGKVYRRDQPVMSKGRMREFYQCDFDIAGSYDAMVPDAEILSLLCEALGSLDIGEFTVKLNHRKILDGIFELAGVPSDKTRSISSAVDKLDKMPWADVKKEMIAEKGLDAAVADKIGEYVGLKGPAKQVLERLMSDEALMAVPSAKAGLDDMALLFDYLEVYGVLDKMSFDMSLARGLDYYTGIIYEAITEASAPPSQPVVPAVPASSSSTIPTTADASSSKPAKPSKSAKGKSKSSAQGTDGTEETDETTVGVGSIAAGGRYDGLVNMFASAAGRKTEPVPCVGVSVGVERVYSIMEMKRKAREGKEAGRKNETEVFVVALGGGGGLIKERMGIVRQLREAGIKAEFMYKNKPKLPAQWDRIDEDQIPFAVILAPAELAAGTVRIKQQLGKEAAEAAAQDGATDKNGVEVKVADMIAYLKERL